MSQSVDDAMEAGAKKRIRRHDVANTNGSPNTRQLGTLDVIQNDEGRKNAVAARQNGNHSTTTNAMRYEHPLPSQVDQVSRANRTAKAVQREASAVSQVSLNLVHRRSLESNGLHSTQPHSFLRGLVLSSTERDEDDFINLRPSQPTFDEAT